MSKKSGSIKLYRGLKTDNFTFVDEAVRARYDSAWQEILKHRQKSKEYPSHLNRDIISLHKETKLHYQVFSDYREISERYLSKTGGILVELDVPIEDILRFFELEIQNYTKRQQHFEIVYTVRSSILAKHYKAWQGKITRIKHS